MSDPPNRLVQSVTQTPVERSDPAPALVVTDQSELQSSASPTHESPTHDHSAHVLPKIVSFKTLARCGEEIWIENDGQIYRLRRTRQGKLILTK